MSQARCNARRRRQAASGFKHLALRQRPRYKKRDVETAARHEQWLRERERARANNPKKAK